MSYNLNQQVWEALNRARQILVIFPKENEGDGATAALALAEVLKKLNKQAEVVCADFSAPHKWLFLPSIKNIKSQLSPLQKFVIKVDLNKNKLASLSYDVKDNHLFIYISPKEGVINRNDVHTASSDFKFDLVVTMDAPDMASLGRIYENNTELFTQTPVINIDHNPANEHFGKINLVDISASSAAEVLFEFLNQIAPEQITAEVATLLLAGMIIKTKNFRSANVSSRTLSNAGKLVDLGAKREEIVRHLYRQRSLAALKLWGEALVNLKNDSKLGLIWLSLKRDDFRRANATESDLPEIIDELLTNSPEAKTIVLLYETAEGSVAGLVVTQQNVDAKLLAQPFAPIGNRTRVKINIAGKDLAAAEQEIIETIKNRLPACR